VFKGRAAENPGSEEPSETVFKGYLKNWLLALSLIQCKLIAETTTMAFPEVWNSRRT
jgi:hypothetical protein